jgi:hypothetical protein
LFSNARKPFLDVERLVKKGSARQRFASIISERIVEFANQGK